MCQNGFLPASSRISHPMATQLAVAIHSNILSLKTQLALAEASSKGTQQR